MTQTSNSAIIARASTGPIHTPWTEFWRRFCKQHLAMDAGVFVITLAMIAILTPHIVPFDSENYFDYGALNAGPSAQHWFGVDSLGRDTFSCILMGTCISLEADLVSVIIDTIIGTILDPLASYYEGWWDRIVMRISDVLFAFPGILLTIGIVVILSNNIINVILAVMVFSIPTSARLVRGNTLMPKHLTYVEAARSIDASDWMIIVRHILSGTISFIVAYSLMRIDTSVITATNLLLPGLDTQSPTPEWSVMLNGTHADMVTALYVAISPSLAIFLVVLAFSLLGDGLHNALDPKIDRR